MLYAIVSDIHGNYNAWAAVLEDIRDIGVDRIICLGDIVGYGPEPGRCVQSIRDVAHACILGNHDAVITKKLDSRAFNDHARKLIEWTELQLNSEEIDFLHQLDYEYSEDCFRCVHGDCDAPKEFNYIVDCEDAELTWNKTKEHIIFCGHSHLPAIFATTSNGDEMCSVPAQDFTLDNTNRYIVNVGSVGSPRDDDLRASYVVFDSATKSVFFRRVGYDFNDFRERVRFVGLNECDVPLLCYVLEEEQADHISLEEEISKSEIVITNEASDLAKTVYLHQVDLSDVLKNAGASKLSNSSSAGSRKKQIIIKKHDNQQASVSPNTANPTILTHKPGVRSNKATSTDAANAQQQDKKKQAQNNDVKYLRNVNAAQIAPGKWLIFIIVFSLIFFVLIGVFFSSSPISGDGIVRYPDADLPVLNTSDKQGTENLLPEIWMSSGDINTIKPYRITMASSVNVRYDNIDGMYGAELIFHNVDGMFAPIRFETPFVEIDPKGKYLILAKVYFEDNNSNGSISMQLVHANASELKTALPSEEIIRFHKKEISKTLYRKGGIPKCFQYRPSTAGWRLAKRTVEGRELKDYMRVMVRGEFTGRISIGGVSIQRID